MKEKQSIVEFVNTIEPKDKENKLLGEIPSKNGLHLITLPFNVQRFKSIYPYIEVHKDNPTNLYIP